MATIATIKNSTNTSTNALSMKIDVSDIIYQIDDEKGNRSPLTVLTARAQKKAATNPKFQWLEDSMTPRWDQANGTVTAGSATVVVDNVGYFRVGDIVKIPSTAEVVEVTAITATTSTLSITRSIGDSGGTAAATIPDNGPLVIIGNANAEGASKRGILTTALDEKYNYTQIIRTPFGVTETYANSDTYGGKGLDYERKKHMLEHRVDIERALLFGERAIDTSGTHPKRYTGGLLYWITTNLKDASGTLTESEFEDFLETGFAYGSTKKVLFASSKVISAINYWAKAKLQMFPKDKTYGIAAMQYLSAHGEVIVVRHNLLEGATYGGQALLLDLDYVKYRPLSNRDTKLITNIQTPGDDQVIDEYLTEAGLEVNVEKAHARLYGVTSYSA